MLSRNHYGTVFKIAEEMSYNLWYRMTWPSLNTTEKERVVSHWEEE